MLREAVLSNRLTLSPYGSDSQNFSPTSLALPTDSLKEDLWSFGFFWGSVLSHFSTVQELYAALQDLFDHIRTVKEAFRPLVEEVPNLQVEPNEERGVSGSYFLVDEAGVRRFIVKPLDEDAGCLHSEGFATPFFSSPFRKHISLYRSSMREVLAYRIAETLGLDSIVPKTSLAIFQSGVFHDFSEGVDAAELERYLETCGFADKEKLCSVQEFVPNAKSLFEALQEFQSNSLTDEEIGLRIDQSDFENANILLWTTYDTDGHLGNFLVYPKGANERGDEVLGLKKIDNGLAFPEKNAQLRNNLSFLPNAEQPLSEEGKEKIAAIDVEQLAKQFEALGLEGAVAALKERIPLLQKLAQEPGITLKEINKALSKIGKNG